LPGIHIVDTGCLDAELFIESQTQYGVDLLGPTRLRRTRYIGLARVRLGHMLTAVELNVLRLSEWFLETARAKTRLPPFARLMADAPAA
jgi:hypothetical protein